MKGFYLIIIFAIKLFKFKLNINPSKYIYIDYGYVRVKTSDYA